MKLPLAKAVAATRAHLSSAVANALPGVLRGMYEVERLPDEIEDACLGEALLRAVIGRSDAVPADLASVTLMWPEGQCNLTPEDAAEHPLVGHWIEETLTAALAAPLIAGARATNLALGSPGYGAVQISETEGVVGGVASMAFTAAGGVEVSVLAVYGAGVVTAPLMTTRTISGNALYRIGADAGALPLAAGFPVSGLELFGVHPAASGAVH